MRALLLTLGFFCFFSALEAQTPYKPKKRKKDYFGKRENPETGKVRPIGLQIQLGPTYTFTKNQKKNETIQSDPAAPNRFQYTQDPNGRFGIYAEIGLVHFNIKDPKIKGFGRIVDYIDYGVGFKLLRGNELTRVDNLDAVGNILSSEVGEGNFSNGYLFGRFAAHKLQYLNKTKNIFLDHSLGINGDFLVTGGSENYKAPVFGPHTFSDPFRLQLHYGLGFGIRLGKGRYLVPGAQLPILGALEWHGGSPKLQWFSSKYYPVLFQLKYIHLFPAKKGQSCFEGDPKDRKRNEEYMQNK